MIGFVLLAWLIAPMAYYTNLWGSKAMPIVSNRVFTSDGYFYNVSAVLTPQLRLNETAYKTYGISEHVETIGSFIDIWTWSILGELRMPAVFAFSYAISFAAIAAVIVHTVLFHGRISIDGRWAFQF